MIRKNEPDVRVQSGIIFFLRVGADAIGGPSAFFIFLWELAVASSRLHDNSVSDTGLLHHASAYRLRESPYPGRSSLLLCHLVKYGLIYFLPHCNLYLLCGIVSRPVEGVYSM